MGRSISSSDAGLADTLQQLSRKLTKLALNIQEPTPHRDRKVPTSLSYQIDDDQIVEAIEALAKRRARRRAYFSAEIIGEPAWDMLLELYVAHKKGIRLSTSLCLVAGVPNSTALRATGLLESNGFLMRRRSADDKRVTYVAITPSGATKIEAYVVDEVRRRVQQLNCSSSKWINEVDHFDNLGESIA